MKTRGEGADFFFATRFSLSRTSEMLGTRDWAGCPDSSCHGLFFHGKADVMATRMQKAVHRIPTAAQRYGLQNEDIRFHLWHFWNRITECARTIVTLVDPEILVPFSPRHGH
jgi:hypothetical protein